MWSPVKPGFSVFEQAYAVRSGFNKGFKLWMKFSGPCDNFGTPKKASIRQ
jgi:hypothetical protein